MSKTGTSVTSGRRGQGFLTQFVRPHLTAGFTVFSAVVLGLSLVVIPPDVKGTRTEVRSVKLAAFRPHSATPLGAVLKQYVNTQANTGVSVTPVIVSAPDITTDGVPALLEFVRTAQSIGSSTDPTGVAAQTGIDTVIPREQSGNFGVSAIPDLSQLASSFNPLWPLAVLFFVVVIPVFAVLLFFFPPAFPATASAVSAIPEPLDLPPLPAKDDSKVAAAPPNSGEVAGEFDGVGSNEVVGESDGVGSNEVVGESDGVGSNEVVGEFDGVGSNEVVGESDGVGSNEVVGEFDGVGSNEAAGDSDGVGSNEAAGDSDGVGSNGAAGESDGVGSNGAAGDSDRVASNRKGPDTRQGAASNQQTAGTGHATSKPAGPANSTADGDPSDASS